MYNDIRMIKHCGEKTAQKYYEQGIYTWTDPRFKAKDPKSFTGKQMEHFIQANRDNKHFLVEYTFEGKELFIDIENVNDIIFMIGVWYKDSENPFIQWTATELTFQEEIRIIKEYDNFVKEFNPDRIYIWGEHEKQEFEKRNKKYKMSINTEKLFNFCKFLEINGFAIPELFNHSLKSVGKLFYKKGYIESTWENDVVDGLDAMEQARLCYKNNLPLDKIQKYNYIDVKVMQEIIYFIQNSQENPSYPHIGTSTESINTQLTDTDRHV